MIAVCVVLLLMAKAEERFGCCAISSFSGPIPNAIRRSDRFPVILCSPSRVQDVIVDNASRGNGTLLLIQGVGGAREQQMRRWFAQYSVWFGAVILRLCDGHVRWMHLWQHLQWRGSRN